MNIKEWFAYTKKDFKDFFWRQSNVLIAFAVFYALSNVAAHYFALSTDPYKISEQFVLSSTTLSDQLGTIKSVGLHPFTSNIKWHNNSGHAEFELNVSSDKNYSRVRTYLTKIDGEWHLQKAHAVTKDHDVIILKQ